MFVSREPGYCVSAFYVYGCMVKLGFPHKRMRGISEATIIQHVCSGFYLGRRLEYAKTERDYAPDGRLVATVVCFSVPDLHFAFWVRFTPNGWVSSGSSCSAF